MLFGVGFVGVKNQKRMNDTNLVKDLQKLAATPSIIAIDGVAGSGKTTLAIKLSEELSNAPVVHMDDLYNGWSNPFSDELVQRVTKQILKPYLISNSASYQKYNWVNKTFSETVDISHPKYLILEGVGSGQSSFRGYIQKLIWIDLDPTIGYQRVIKRDGEHIKESMKKFLIDQEKHFNAELTNNHADYIIKGAP